MTSIAHYFDSSVDGVEIDPLTTELGRRYFDLDTDDPRLTVYHQDGRRFLERAEQRYDVIIVDMYGGGPYVPFHVATMEFFQSVAAALKDDGVMAINLPFFAEQSELQRYYLNTIGRAFGHAWRAGQVLYATRSAPWTRASLTAALARVEQPTLHALAEKLLDKLQPAALEAAADGVFSDDLSSIEALTFDAISAEWLASERAERLRRVGY